jgi:hypothetical protein
MINHNSKLIITKKDKREFKSTITKHKDYDKMYQLIKIKYEKKKSDLMPITLDDIATILNEILHNEEPKNIILYLRSDLSKD